MTADRDADEADHLALRLRADAEAQEVRRFEMSILEKRSVAHFIENQASEIAALRSRVAQMADALQRARLALPVLRTVLSKISKDGMSLGVKASEETLADIEAALSPSPPAEARSCRGTRHD